LRKVVLSNRFRRDLKQSLRRGLKREKLDIVVDEIAKDGAPRPSRRPHPLAGLWTGFMECHIGFDWLLIYQVDREEVRLYRTGTHSDLFE
jgi:mRNA interferase YafQ